MIRIAPFLLALLPAAAAFAQTAPPQAAAVPRPTIVAEPVALAIAAFDANGDAVVTRAELAAGIARAFGAAPSLGYIGYGDWAKRWLGDANALPSQFEVDLDHDDRITAAELARTFDRIFTRFDLDRDGAVTRAELVTIRTGFEGDRGRRRGKPGEDGAPPRRR